MKTPNQIGFPEQYRIFQPWERTKIIAGATRSTMREAVAFYGTTPLSRGDHQPTELRTPNPGEIGGVEVIDYRALASDY